MPTNPYITPNVSPLHLFGVFPYLGVGGKNGGKNGGTDRGYNSTAPSPYCHLSEREQPPTFTVKEYDPPLTPLFYTCLFYFALYHARA